MLPCPEASQVALTFLGSKSEDLAETHLAGFCDNGGCVSSGHLLPLSTPGTENQQGPHLGSPLV